MKLYVAGPYKASTIFGVIINIIKARNIAAKLWRMGYTVICPHANSALTRGLSDAEWYRRDIELLKNCDGIVMMPGWRKSKGAVGEYVYAREHGIEIYHWNGVKKCLLKKK